MLVTIIWILSIAFVELMIFNIISKQIIEDLNSPKETIKFKRNNPLKTGKGNKHVKEDSIFPYLSRYMSLISVVFSIMVFGLVYNLFLEDFYEYASGFQNDLTSIPLLLAVAAFGALVSSFFMKRAVIENDVIKIARARATIITGLSFIFFSLLFVFFYEVTDLKYNLVKGITLSFCIGTLFYVIFGQTLNFEFLNKSRKKQTSNSNKNQFKL